MDIAPQGTNPNYVSSKADNLASAGTSAEKQRFLGLESVVFELKDSLRIELETGHTLRHAIDATWKYDVVIKAAGRPTFPSFQHCAVEDRKMLRHSACPIWIIRRNQHEAGLKILAAVDLTPPDSDSMARVVLAQAAALAEKQNAQLELASIWRIPNELGLSSRINLRRFRKRMKKTYRNQLKSLMDEFQLAKAAGHLIHGDMRKAIPAFVKQHKFDLVVIGERAGLMQYIIGNTAELLLADSNCSVLSINKTTAYRRVHGSLIKSRTANNAPTVL